MKGALIILLVTIAGGLLVYLYDKYIYKKRTGTVSTDEDGRTPGVGGLSPDKEAVEVQSEEKVAASDSSSECCGMHIVCEKQSLMPVDDEIIYYDDEELDRYKGRGQNEYSPEETEEFRDVLLTLLPEDVAGWSRSITLRGIELPADVREELLMIVAEQRGKLA